MNFDEYNVPHHIRRGLILYVECGYRTGRFLEYVLINDLINASRYADAINRENLSNIADFVRNEMPEGSYGSVSKVMEWMNKGGLGLGHGNN